MPSSLLPLIPSPTICLQSAFGSEKRCRFSINIWETEGINYLRNGGGDDVAGAPPWNPMTMRAACNEPGDESTRITGVKRGSNEGGGDRDSQKLKFSVSLLREEIKKDSTA
ncbi:hypothetical protein IGI04_036708 [Brassica rapa subsp. trilocularis]|uniref:Uncharacterized protein n=1 Tax=Brassica rapa subsp. trilocularis TaxID=1813537 RepID=A0ABQ7LFC8_BRACM|nr:hypothetical protein IGI04_036708 [Brassica rapa subsp. trilocularis]